MKDNTFVNQLKLVEKKLRSDFLETHLTQIISKYLHIENPIDLLPEISLFELGLTSLQAVEIKYELEKLLNQSFESTIIFNFPTIGKLVKFFNENLVCFLDTKEITSDNCSIYEKEYALKMLRDDFSMS